MVKLKVREESLKYGARKKKKIIRREEEIEKMISDLEINLSSTNVKENERTELWTDLEIKRRELEEIIEYRTKGAILRSKSQWYNEGEKNTKYFLNLEKRHCKQGTITQLKTSDTTYAHTDKDILEECESFYKNLYTSTINAHNSADSVFFTQATGKCLSNEETDSCEGLLNTEECLVALKSMANGKSPGSDGFPAEFYKVFWRDLATLLIDALNFSKEFGELSVSQKRGIIKLIPKKEADLNLLKNWRPITLLNFDYKLATKTIANRIKAVLPNIISNDQSGFIKGRFIGENIRLIDSAIKYTASKNIPGLLLFLDFEKAFDTLEWPFIHKTLIHFGFGPSLQKWFHVFYRNIESSVLNNGWESNLFAPTRGVRQGCPLSPYLFILSVEILADAIRKKKEIRGLSVDNNDIKLSQYADDTTLILDGSEQSLLAALATLDTFSCASGLRLNSKKTEALWIGSSADRDFKLCPEKDFKWPKKKVKALGVWFSTNPDESTALNYKDKLEKVRGILSSWRFRRLGLFGKITVLKSLVASQLVYVFSSCPTNPETINEIN